MSTTTGTGNATITITPETRPVNVFFHDTVIATTTKALVLKEGTYPPVHYIPKAHVAMALLSKTEKHTTCPHKGEASYWTISAGGSAAENSVWGYETPKDSVKAIADHVAFYPNMVRIEVG